MQSFPKYFFLLIVILSVFSCRLKTEKKNLSPKKKDKILVEQNMSAELVESLVFDFYQNLAKIQENRIFYKIETLENDKNTIDDFVFNRYAAVSARATESIQILKNYNLHLKKQYGFSKENQIASYKRIIQGDLKKNCKDSDPKQLLVALKNLLEDREFIGQSDNFRLDIVDVFREILVLSNNRSYQKIKEDISSKDAKSLSKHSQEFLLELLYMDEVLGSRNEFSFGVHLSKIKNLGNTRADKNLIESTFSKKIIESNYQMSGLIKTVYQPLWSTYLGSLQENWHFQETYKADVSMFLENWILHTKELPSFSKGDELEIVLEVLGSNDHLFAEWLCWSVKR